MDNVRAIRYTAGIRTSLFMHIYELKQDQQVAFDRSIILNCCTDTKFWILKNWNMKNFENLWNQNKLCDEFLEWQVRSAIGWLTASQTLNETSVTFTRRAGRLATYRIIEVHDGPDGVSGPTYHQRTTSYMNVFLYKQLHRHRIAPFASPPLVFLRISVECLFQFSLINFTDFIRAQCWLQQPAGV